MLKGLLCLDTILCSRITLIRMQRYCGDPSGLLFCLLINWGLRCVARLKGEVIMMHINYISTLQTVICAKIIVNSFFSMLEFDFLPCEEDLTHSLT